MENSYDSHFLSQIFSTQNRLENILEEIVQNIFNLYDDDGDGKLDINDYISFISDLMYISILMNRLDGTAYTMDNLMKFAKWSSSNFETNLFREPQKEISYESFVHGVIYALTENKHLPVLGQANFLCLSSFIPEILNYFSYYTKISKRRGWPTIDISEESNNDRDEDIIHCPFQTRLELINQTNNTQQRLQQITNGEITNLEISGNLVVSSTENVRQPAPILQQLSNQEQQIREYQNRRRVQYQLDRIRLTREHELMRERDQPQQLQSQQQPPLQQQQQPPLQQQQQPPLQQQQQQQQQQQPQQQQQQPQQQQQQQPQQQQQELQEQEVLRRQQIMQQQISQIQRLQLQLRNRIRQEEFSRQNIDQFGDTTVITTPPHELKDYGNIVITKETMGYDPIDGEVSIIDFIKINPEDNIVFRMNEHYYMASKERIKSMIQIGEKDNSVFYGCICEIVGNWTDPETWGLLEQTVIPEIRYFNIQQLGLPIRYVSLKDIQAILDGEHHYFIIEKPEDSNIIPSFASDNILNHGVGSMSGSHCQDGQSDIVYTIKKFTPIDNSDPPPLTIEGIVLL